MSRYLRPRIPSEPIFFTVNLSRRGSRLLTNNIDALRSAVGLTLKDHPVDVIAWTVLPDHMHAIWILPDGEVDYSTRWSIIKARFSRQMPLAARSASHVKRREHGIWQRRFWEHHIRSTKEQEALMNYCWINPVKHGLVNNPEDWPFSSFARDRQRCAVNAHPTATLHTPIPPC